MSGPSAPAAAGSHDDTLSIDRSAPSRGTALPQLFIVLQCVSPISMPTRHGLAGIDEVDIGRGTYGIRREVAGGVRKLIIRLADPHMSASHARIRSHRGVFTLSDLQSKNGSFINGVAQEEITLADGDLLQLGSTFFSFRFTGCERGDFRPSTAAAPPHGLWTLLPDLTESFARLSQLASSKVPILVLGESGTGKELIARAVHQLSGRAGPFVAVNCGALPSTLVESELFGYRKGAFSGALEDRPGLIRMADRGTLLLDEVADLAPVAQPALLRVLQEHEVMSVGATRAVPVDLRLVAATHRDLAELEQANEFRGDLRARLEGWTIRLPPLRERREDMGILLAALLQRTAGERAASVSVSTAAARTLFSYAWPFNIRELEQRLSAALVFDQDEIKTLDLPSPESRPVRERERAPEPRLLSPADREQRDVLVTLLARHAGNISAVAREMGKERSQIRRWIKRYRLDVHDL